MPRSNCDLSTHRVIEHHERRRAGGENLRSFYLREEHMQFLRRFKIANGLPNLNAALQSALESVHSYEFEGKDSPEPREINPERRDGA